MRKSRIYAVWFVVSYFCLFNAFIAYAGERCGADGRFYYCYQYVYTPRFSKVEVKNYTSDLSSTEKQSLNLYFRTTYSKAIFLSSSTIKYNCHSYAWYSQFGLYWMADPSAYMKDGSYAGYCSISPANGDKIYYPNGGNGNHSAISLGNKWAQSKWGMGPLMKHPIDYGPASYKMSCYYGFTRIK